MILPLSRKLDEHDLMSVFSGAIENTGSHGINQILNAGSIGYFFSQLYAETKGAQINHERIWKEFHDQLNERNKSYQGLVDLMIEDGLLVAPVIEDDDDIPF